MSSDGAKSKNKSEKKKEKKDKAANDKTDSVEQKSTKRKAEEEPVHSANDWEHVDLGDDDRKNKFLRLMGASKKDHHGKIVIGEKSKAHARSKQDTEKVSEDLEDQFNQGIEMKLTGAARRHVGLGFQPEAKVDEEPIVDKPQPSESEATVATAADSESKKSSKSEQRKFGLFVRSNDST